MPKKVKLSKSMTEEQFDNGYWYALEIKEFARKIGIPAISKLRKDELEKAIKMYLRTDKVALPTKRKLKSNEAKDSDGGLNLKQKVKNYTNNKETKDWIVKNAQKMNPNFKERSGARLRLNRWREEQQTKGRSITYGDLVRQYVKINAPETTYKKYPSGRYINFLSDFLKKEKNSSREDAIAAWHQLKKLDIPKDYKSWKRAQK